MTEVPPSAPGPPIEVVVVEDHPPVRQGVELLLGCQGFRIVGSAGSAAAGELLIRARRPDVSLIDVDLGDGSGTDLTRMLIDEMPGTAIVLYTGSVNAAVLEQACASGAYGVVLKMSPVERVGDALRAAAAGRNYVDESLAGRLPAADARVLSAREAQVLGMLACGATTRQVAGELFLSSETVQTHIRNATRKLGARGRLHAVVLALARGEIDQREYA